MSGLCGAPVRYSFVRAERQCGHSAACDVVITSVSVNVRLTRRRVGLLLAFSRSNLERRKKAEPEEGAQNTKTIDDGVWVYDDVEMTHQSHHTVNVSRMIVNECVIVD